MTIAVNAPVYDDLYLPDPDASGETAIQHGKGARASLITQCQRELAHIVMMRRAPEAACCSPFTVASGTTKTIEFPVWLGIFSHRVRIAVTCVCYGDYAGVLTSEEYGKIVVRSTKDPTGDTTYIPFSVKDPSDTITCEDAETLSLDIEIEDGDESDFGIQMIELEITAPTGTGVRVFSIETVVYNDRHVEV